MEVPYRIEGFMWHQGENDIFNKEFKPTYGCNLKNFLASWRRDLKWPDLKLCIGEMCTKTIWGMDMATAQIHPHLLMQAFGGGRAVSVRRGAWK